MPKRYLTALILVLATAFASNFIGRPDSTSSQPRYKPFISAGSNAVVKRKWRSKPPRKLFSIEGGEHGVLTGPLRLKVDATDHMFVVDFGEMRVKEFLADGRFSKVFGAGRGQGLGEFKSIPDIFVTSREVWIPDSENGRITVFNRNGRISRVIRPPHKPRRLALLGKDRFVLLLPPGQVSLFGSFGKDGNLLAHFGEYIEEQDKNSLVLDGWIEPTPDGGFVYAGMYASLVAVFDGSLGARFVKQTIDAHPLPRLITNAQGWTFIDKEAPVSSWSISVTAGEFHLLTPVQSGLKQMRVIDSYRLSDGSYLYSRRVPEPCERVVVTQGNIFTVNESTISKWAIAN